MVLPSDEELAILLLKMDRARDIFEEYKELNKATPSPQKRSRKPTPSSPTPPPRRRNSERGQARLQRLADTRERHSRRKSEIKNQIDEFALLAEDPGKCLHELHEDAVANAVNTNHYGKGKRRNTLFTDGSTILEEKRLTVNLNGTLDAEKEDQFNPRDNVRNILPITTFANHLIIQATIFDSSDASDYTYQTFNPSHIRRATLPKPTLNFNGPAMLHGIRPRPVYQLPGNLERRARAHSLDIDQYGHELALRLAAFEANDDPEVESFSMAWIRRAEEAKEKHAIKFANGGVS